MDDAFCRSCTPQDASFCLAWLDICSAEKAFMDCVIGCDVGSQGVKAILLPVFEQSMKK
jgi:hypothetical protein